MDQGGLRQLSPRALGVAREPWNGYSEGQPSDLAGQLATNISRYLQLQESQPRYVNLSCCRCTANSSMSY